MTTECPQCETEFLVVGRFCPDCGYYFYPPSPWARLRRRLHRAALTAGESPGRSESDAPKAESRACSGGLDRPSDRPPAAVPAPAVSAVLPSSGGES